MDVNKIRSGLEGYPKVQVEKFVAHVWDLFNARKGTGKKNPWMEQRSESFLITAFKDVAATGLFFDGVHITLQSTGVSYDYQAYKNKMLLVYPESVIDVELVYEGDTFTFDKDSGRVAYTHNIINPFGREDANVIGGYCVIKNKRGEFLTILTRAEIDKHRKVAKTDFIWAAWFVEMARKTVIKKACKQHFEDVFQDITEADNENSDLDLPLDVDLGIKGEVEAIETVEALQEYWEKNKDSQQANAKGFNMLISKRKEELEPTVEEEEEPEVENADS